MSLGTWDPKASTSELLPENIDMSLYIKQGKLDEVEQHVSQLTASDINTLTPIMKQDQIFWKSIAKNLSTENIVQLIQFFI